MVTVQEYGTSAELRTSFYSATIVDNKLLLSIENKLLLSIVDNTLWFHSYVFMEDSWVVGG